MATITGSETFMKLGTSLAVGNPYHHGDDDNMLAVSAATQSKFCRSVYLYPQDRARKKLNSSLSFGQAAVTFCLPGATSCLSPLMILLIKTAWTLVHWASELLELLAQ